MKHAVGTGLSFGRLSPALVPLFEEMEAMRFAGYTERQWRDMDSEEKAFSVAHYRMHGMVEMHKEDAVAEKVKEKTDA